MLPLKTSLFLWIHCCSLSVLVRKRPLMCRNKWIQNFSTLQQQNVIFYSSFVHCSCGYIPNVHYTTRLMGQPLSRHGLVAKRVKKTQSLIYWLSNFCLEVSWPFLSPAVCRQIILSWWLAPQWQKSDYFRNGCAGVWHSAATMWISMHKVTGYNWDFLSLCLFRKTQLFDY